MIPLAWFGAYWFRFNLSTIPDQFWYPGFLYLPFVMAVQVSMFWFFGLYRGVWRFSSLPDLVRITKAVCSGILVIAILLFIYNRLQGVPRAVVPLYLFLLLLFLCVPRFVYRFWKERVFIERTGKRALIVGAGAAGELLARDLLADFNSGFVPVAFVDDARNKFNREIRGIRVVGAIKDIPRLIEAWEIEFVLIAIPSATDVEMRRIVEYCELSNVPFKTLPSVRELLRGPVSKNSLRDVKIEDILGREPINLDWEGIQHNLQDKTVLVTGGGGSIGSELCKQIAGVKPGKLIVLDHSEYNLYKIDTDLTQLYPRLKHLSLLGDVTDRIAVQRIIQSHKPDVIFHAAAYKHVPLLESQAREAVHNNLVGTKIIAEEAISGSVDCFVLISTDKAVNPTNVMGASKRAAEVFCQNLGDSSSTRFITVRFGNVLDSAGSVVPLFREQIRAGGPVTVTDPEITRYFMTIPEACQLIMQAESIGQGGEIFVLDMGKPVKISYLAEQMIRLSGKVPGEDIEIRYIGLRPGEKLYEELFYSQESLVETGYNKLKLAKAKKYEQSACLTRIADIEEACDKYDNGEIIALLQQLVRECASPCYSHVEQTD